MVNTAAGARPYHAYGPHVVRTVRLAPQPAADPHRVARDLVAILLGIDERRRRHDHQETGQ